MRTISKSNQLIYFKIIDEMDKFESNFKEPGDAKLLIDFSGLSAEFAGKQMFIDDIKYKRPKKNLTKEVVDLKNRKKNPKNLF